VGHGTRLVFCLQAYDLVGDILQALTGWLTAHTYAVVFVATVIDATGVPFPGRILLAAAGALAASTSDVSVLLVIALGAAGVVVSDHLWYFAGALGTDRLLLRAYCRLTGNTSDCRDRATGWLERFGTLIIVVGRFVAVVRMVAWPLARAHGVRYPMFLALDVPAAVVWTAVWVGLGWLLGEQWADASEPMRWVGGAIAVAAVVTFALVSLWRRRRRMATAA
jgi:membrane protein DedA with SNARE-associated domain